MYGESHTNPFHECRHSFIICCSEDRSQLFLTDERLRELRQPEEQVRGVLTISRREWMEYPSVDVTVSADADYVGQLHRHAEFAFIHGVGSLSVQLSFSGDDIPDLSDPQRFDGLYAVRDFHFLYWQAENVTKNDADEQD